MKVQTIEIFNDGKIVHFLKIRSFSKVYRIQFSACLEHKLIDAVYSRWMTHPKTRRNPDNRSFIDEVVCDDLIHELKYSEEEDAIEKATKHAVELAKKFLSPISDESSFLNLIADKEPFNEFFDNTAPRIIARAVFNCTEGGYSNQKSLEESEQYFGVALHRREGALLALQNLTK